MAWLRSGKSQLGYAVLTPLANGAAALRLEGGGERPRVALARFETETPANAEAWRRLAQAAGLERARLITLLDPAFYQTVIIEAPNVPEDELRGAIRWKVKDMINFHTDDTVLEYLPVPGGAGRPDSLFVIAAQASAVRELAAPFQAADLPLAVIDIRETAQHHLARLLAPEDYAVSMMHFDGQNALLTFSHGDHLVFARRIEGRGASGEFLLERLAMETQRSVDYFERQFSWLPLSKLFLAPTEVGEPLAVRLRGYLPVGVELVDLDALFDLSAAPELASIGSRTTVFHLLGAALRDG
ncbi:MAG: hypothetical protein HZB71_13455 [Betaproteobacteria bacterium]|nr:hypothetical protein [Betaproteobacteria bacterium]